MAGFVFSMYVNSILLNGNLANLVFTVIVPMTVFCTKKELRTHIKKTLLDSFPKADAVVFTISLNNKRDFDLNRPE